MNKISYKHFYLIFLILTLTFLLIKNKESFTLSIGAYTRFLKDDKFSKIISERDLELINEINDCYRNKNLYYKCINTLNIPYLRNPKKNKSFEKEINYRKHKHVSHLLPYKPKHY